MALEQIQNGETGFKAREKINAAIQTVNNLSVQDGDFLPIDGSEPMTGPFIVRSAGLDPNDPSIKLQVSGIYAGTPDGVQTTQKLFIASFAGYGLDEILMSMATNKNPEVRWGSTDHQVFHQGFPPTALRAFSQDMYVDPDEEPNFDQLLWLAECRAKHWDMMGEPAKVDGWKVYYRKLVAWRHGEPMPIHPAE